MVPRQRLTGSTSPAGPTTESKAIPTSPTTPAARKSKWFEVLRRPGTSPPWLQVDGAPRGTRNQYHQRSEGLRLLQLRHLSPSEKPRYLHRHRHRATRRSPRHQRSTNNHHRPPLLTKSRRSPGSPSDRRGQQHDGRRYPLIVRQSPNKMTYLVVHRRRQCPRLHQERRFKSPTTANRCAVTLRRLTRSATVAFMRRHPSKSPRDVSWVYKRDRLLRIPSPLSGVGSTDFPTAQ